jgi:hypothetical protein
MTAIFPSYVEAPVTIEGGDFTQAWRQIIQQLLQQLQINQADINSALSLGATLTITNEANADFSLTINLTGNTDVTFPTSGTLATREVYSRDMATYTYFGGL